MKVKLHFPSLLFFIARIYFYQVLQGVLHRQVTEAPKTVQRHRPEGQGRRMSRLFFLNVIFDIPAYWFHRLFPTMRSGSTIVSDSICYSKNFFQYNFLPGVTYRTEKPTHTVL